MSKVCNCSKQLHADLEYDTWCRAPSFSNHGSLITALSRPAIPLIRCWRSWRSRASNRLARQGTALEVLSSLTLHYSAADKKIGVSPLLARYVFDLAFEGKIKVAVVSHPSLLKPTEDFEVIVFDFSILVLFIYVCAEIRQNERAATHEHQPRGPTALR
jgi:hypothetical protein